MNRPFIKFMKRKLPYVTVKIAQSVDGKIADAKGRSQWITSKSSRRLVHELRARNDAVMIGVNTLLSDNPSLTSRIQPRTGKQPMRIILDTNLRTPLRSRILQRDKSRGAEVLIVGGKGSSLRKKALLEDKGAKVIAQHIFSLLDAKEHLTQAIHIKLAVEKVNKENLEDLRAILQRHKGDCKAYVHLCTDPQCETIIRTGDKFKVKPDRRLIEEVNRYFGGEVVSAVVANGPGPIESSRFQNRNNRGFQSP